MDFGRVNHVFKSCCQKTTFRKYPSWFCNHILETLKIIGKDRYYNCNKDKKDYIKYLEKKRIWANKGFGCLEGNMECKWTKTRSYGQRTR